MLQLRRTIPLAVVIAAIAAAPAVAAKKTHRYSASLVSATLSTAKGYPGPGGTALLAGSLKSKPFGAGAVVDRLTITGQPQRNVITFKGTEVAYFAGGSVRDRFTGTSTIGQDGAQAVVVNGRITGGTARFKGVTGSYRFTGTIPAGSTVLTGSSTGTFAF